MRHPWYDVFKWDYMRDGYGWGVNDLFIETLAYPVPLSSGMNTINVDSIQCTHFAVITSRYMFAPHESYDEISLISMSDI